MERLLVEIRGVGAAMPGGRCQCPPRGLNLLQTAPLVCISLCAMRQCNCRVALMPKLRSRIMCCPSHLPW